MASRAQHETVQRAVVVVAALVAAGVAALAAAFGAVASFALAAWAPAAVAFGCIAAGVVTFRQSGDLLARCLAGGLVVGALLALLLWPLLAIDTGTLSGTR